MPATLLEARGIRATAFRPPPGNCAVQGRQFPAPGYRAAQGRRPSGPRAIARRKGEGLPSSGSASRKAGGHACTTPGSARRESGGLSALGNRAAQGRRPSVSRKRLAQGWRTCLHPSWKRAARGVLPTRARLPAGNAAFLGPPPGWGSRGTGEENPPGRGMGLGGFRKREGDQRESLVETSGRCSRSSRSVRPRPGVSSRWMWPSRMPMSPSMISGKVR